jgi:endonuclease/exonuclease/phosphatase (EEP) superfamily protein YafD
MKLVLVTLGSCLIALTVLSHVRSAQWWIRIADFPRVQIALALALVGGLFVPYFDSSSVLDAGFGLALVGSFLYQSFRIFPYTPLASRQVLESSPGGAAQSIKILISNVLMENRRDKDFVALVRECDPDLILVVETDAWWDERLRVLDGSYPHAIKRPQSNAYGMHLLSRLKLGASQVRFLVEEDVPSIRTGVHLRSNHRIMFYGLHPRPPEPRQDTEERDAELLIVGREVKEGGRPAIVAGDLNDVAWSHTTRLFQRISGMLDPRRGRGMFSTFHAGCPPFRWPLDHVFHDASFTLARLQRLRSIGSDHFPILVELKYEPRAAVEQEAPEADREDLREARDRIAEGRAADG